MSPWMEVNVDFCDLTNGKHLLVVIDNYSHYPEVEMVSITSASTVIPKQDKILSAYGIPAVIKTDNVPPFKARNSINLQSILVSDMVNLLHTGHKPMEKLRGLWEHSRKHCELLHQMDWTRNRSYSVSSAVIEPLPTVQLTRQLELSCSADNSGQNCHTLLSG